MLHDDLFEMFDSILAYVKEHPGCEILNADDPMALRLGFCTKPPKITLLFRVMDFLGRWISYFRIRTEVQEWQIPLTRIKSSMAKEGVSEETRELLRATLMTPLGRSNLSKSLTMGIDPLLPS